jgi:Domain of unknown function (DUF4041)/Meiotically up-regulated gene 113
MNKNLKFNPPPGWPKPPAGWQPPAGWSPDPNWPEMPDGWQLWIDQADPIPQKPDESHDRDPSSNGDIANLHVEIASLRAQLLQAQATDELVMLSDEAVLQSVGIYRYHHPLENAADYKVKLKEIGARLVGLVKGSQAIEVSSNFTFENSLARGAKLSADLAKLMLRAYNSEADNCIRSLRAGNVQTAKKRLEASRKAIVKLGAIMEMRVSDAYHQLRLEEIELTADWLMKKHEEREKQKEERARIREEKRVEKEFAEERERLNKEKLHLENAIAALADRGEADPDLLERLDRLIDAIEQNDYRLANIRSGYVYVISNRGAFGENVVKIGLTRRLDPQVRIAELGGASVPFRFDVHALFFSEDAVTLENELHKHFQDRSVNAVNQRKEFFFATPSEVRDVLMEKVGSLLEFSEAAEALEYFQSSKYWPADLRE